MSKLVNKLQAPQRGNTKNFFKPKAGSNRLRILAIGNAWEAWVRGADQATPHRRETKYTNVELDALGVVAEDGQRDRQKDIYIAHVWDYAEEADSTWSISQATIMREIYNLIDDEDWGDLSGYDITIEKSGEGKETRYMVNPKPKKEFAHMAELRHWDLGKMFEGGDPFEIE